MRETYLTIWHKRFFAYIMNHCLSPFIHIRPQDVENKASRSLSPI